MKKIALISYDLRSGGSQRALSEISFALGEQYEFYSIVFDSSEKSYDINAELIDINVPSKKSKLQKVINTFKRARGIKKAVEKNGIDIAMAFTPIANRALRFSGVKCRKIAACRGFEHLMKAPGEYHACCNKGCEILFNSRESLDYFVKLYPEDKDKCRVIYNVLDIEKINAKAMSELPVEHREFYASHKTISNVGIFSRHKGHWNLLKSFEILKETVPDAGLVLIGHDGEYEKEIADMISRNKYASDILTVGYSDNTFMYVKNSDVYTLSSTFEGFPNALAEAMALGCVCVSTLCRTGPGELLDEAYEPVEIDDYKIFKNGIAVPCMDEKANFEYSEKNKFHGIYAGALEKALTDDNLRATISENAKKRAEKLDKNKINKQYIDFFDNNGE